MIRGILPLDHKIFAHLYPFTLQSINYEQSEHIKHNLQNIRLHKQRQIFPSYRLDDIIGDMLNAKL